MGRWGGEGVGLGHMTFHRGCADAGKHRESVLKGIVSNTGCLLVLLAGAEQDANIILTFC